MDRTLRTRTMIFAGILAFSVLYLLPTVAGSSLPSWYFFSKKINLGLDLKGGARFVYSIDLDAAVDDKASEIKRDLDVKLAEKDLAATVSTPRSLAGALTIKPTDAAKRADIEKLVMSEYKDIIATRACSAKEGEAVCVRISTKFADDVRRRALSQAVKTVEERVNAEGVAEPTVIQKDDQIIVEMPGLAEEATVRVQETIARTAKLEFKIVANDDPVMKAIYKHVGSAESPVDPEGIKQGIKAYTDAWGADDAKDTLYDYYLTASDRNEKLTAEEAKAVECRTENLTADRDGKFECVVEGRWAIRRYLAALGNANPAMAIGDNFEVGYEKVEPQSGDEGEKRPYWRSYYLERAVRLTGSAVSNAVVDWDGNTGRPHVLVDFNRYGGRQFGDLTSANIGKKMAIILDGKITSAPVIQSAIRQGRSTITVGGANARAQEVEAQSLVNVLKTGALPARLREESHATLGPTLGRDAVDKAQLAFALGAVLVMAIMLFIYRLSGWVAMAGTILNVLFQLVVMAAFGATLTLPGIAALVLTIGFGVDGNILIYERIRDELLLGKSVKGAVDIGFSRAFSSILDGQLTTAAAGWVLLQYGGSSTIEGFAKLLLIGIATTLFVNVWVTRLLFDWYIAKKKGELATISI